jgi:hypothetical protein
LDAEPSSRFQFSSLRHSPPKLLDIAQIAAAAFAPKKAGDA